MFNRLFQGRTAQSERVEPPVQATPVVVKPGEAAAPGVNALVSSSSWEEFQEFFKGLDGDAIAVTREGAMNLTAVWACVSLIAGTTGTLSCRVVQRQDGGGDTMLNDHPVNELINVEPHEDFTPEVAFEGVTALAVLEGNGFFEIERSRSGRITALRPMLDNVHAEAFRRRGSGRWAYAFTEDGERFGRDPADVLHFRGSPTIKNYMALSPLKCLARGIKLGIDADKYAAQWFRDGGTPPGYLTFEGSVEDPQIADEIRNNWQKKYGGLKNAHRPAVLTNGGKFVSLVSDPETAQLFQSRTFQVTDIARAFGVPAHLIGETEKSTTWGTGINAQTAQFYILTLRKHLKRWEGEMEKKLLTMEERRAGIGIKFNMDALLRADTKARYEAHKIALGGTQAPGWMTQEEVRAKEGLPAIEGDEGSKVLFRPDPKAKPEGGDGTEPKTGDE